MMMHLNNILSPIRENFPGASVSKRLFVLSKATLETAIGKKSFQVAHIFNFVLETQVEERLTWAWNIWYIEKISTILVTEILFWWSVQENVT